MFKQMKISRQTVSMFVLMVMMVVIIAPVLTIGSTSAMPYIDVHTSHWFYRDVKYVHDNGLFQGETLNKFEPQKLATRGMVVTVLSRAAGVNTSTFDDDLWYSVAVDWGVNFSITDGKNMEDKITREELVTMLHRYLKEPASTGNYNSFKDAKDVSDWASNAMKWAVKEKVIIGYDNNTLMPQWEATRAEVAAIMHRFIEAEFEGGLKSFTKPAAFENRLIDFNYSDIKSGYNISNNAALKSSSLGHFDKSELVWNHGWKLSGILAGTNGTSSVTFDLTKARESDTDGKLVGNVFDVEGVTRLSGSLFMYGSKADSTGTGTFKLIDVDTGRVIVSEVVNQRQFIALNNVDISGVKSLKAECTFNTSDLSEFWFLEPTVNGTEVKVTPTATPTASPTPAPSTKPVPFENKLMNFSFSTSLDSILAPARFGIEDSSDYITNAKLQNLNALTNSSWENGLCFYHFSNETSKIKFDLTKHRESSSTLLDVEGTTRLNGTLFFHGNGTTATFKMIDADTDRVILMQNISFNQFITLNDIDIDGVKNLRLETEFPSGISGEEAELWFLEPTVNGTLAVQ